MRDAYLKRQRKLEAKQENEKLKLQSSILNTLAAACIISSLVFPIIREGNISSLISFKAWFWFFFGFMLHWIATKLMKKLKSED